METASKGQANLVEEILKKKRRGKPLVTAVELDPQGYTAFGRVARETPASLGLFANRVRVRERPTLISGRSFVTGVILFEFRNGSLFIETSFNHRVA